MKPSNLTIQMNAIEQYFHAILLFMLHKVVLTLKSVDETSECDHSNEHCFLGCCYSLQVGPKFQACGRNRSEISPKPNDQYLNFVCKILIPGEKLHCIQLTYKPYTSLHHIKHITHVCIVQHGAS